MFLEGAFDAPFGFLFGERKALVKSLFPPTHGELKLYKMPLSVQANRHQCQAFRAGFSDERTDLALPKEELPGTGIVVVDFDARMAVTGDESIGQVEFIAMD